MGAATRFGVYHIAVVLSIVNLLTLQYLTPLKKEIKMEAEREKWKTGEMEADE